MKKYLGFFLLAFSLASEAQFSYSQFALQVSQTQVNPIPKLYQRNMGVILGLQKGASTFIEFGGEAHWRKISLRKPRITGATVSMEYNFGDHVVGYKAGGWMKQGRINFTYGANLVYFTDFKGLAQYGVNPAIGFRLAGFHLTNGFNILMGDNELEGPNTLYLSLRYYFPVRNKFVWDRREQEKRKRDRERAREKRHRDNENKEEEKKGLRKLLRL